jgi:hypothetical protein
MLSNKSVPLLRNIPELSKSLFAVTTDNLSLLHINEKVVFTAELRDVDILLLT